MSDEQLVERGREWSGLDPVQQVFMDGYFKDATQAGTAIHQAGELLADYGKAIERLQAELAEARAENERLQGIIGRALEGASI